MRAIVGLGLLIAFAAAGAAIWANSPSSTQPANAMPLPSKGITALELEQQIDVKKLPVLDVADTF